MIRFGQDRSDQVISLGQDAHHLFPGGYDGTQFHRENHVETDYHDGFNDFLVLDQQPSQVLPVCKIDQGVLRIGYERREILIGDEIDSRFLQ